MPLTLDAEPPDLDDEDDPEDPEEDPEDEDSGYVDEDPTDDDEDEDEDEVGDDPSSPEDPNGAQETEAKGGCSTVSQGAPIGAVFAAGLGLVAVGRRRR